MAKIFLVESGSETGQKLVHELSMKGHDARIIKSTASVIPEVSKGSPDLVLLDLVLKGKEGFQVLKDLKKNSKTKNVPVVIFTDMSEEAGYSESMDNGAYDYVIKSHRSPAQFAVMINTILEETNDK